MEGEQLTLTEWITVLIVVAVIACVSAWVLSGPDFLRVLLYSGKYLLEQGQRYRVRKQYKVIDIRAGYSNTAWISFIATDDQCGSIHLGLHCAVAPMLV